MAVQTSVTAAPAVGLVGQLATTAGAEFTSRLAEEAIGEGIWVHPGNTNPETTCRLPDGANQVTGVEHTLLGLSVLDPYRTAAAYADGDLVLIMTRGEMFVDVTNATLAGGKVFVTVTTGASDGTTGTPHEGAIFTTVGTGPEIARVVGSSAVSA